jgi:hypothetical protein
MAGTERGGIVDRVAIALPVLVMLAATARTPALGQSCSFDEQCQTAMCTSDGNCSVTALPNGTPCDDFNSCTTSSQCVSGSCTAISFAPTNTACDDSNPCTSNDSCDPTGKCTGTLADNGAPCSYPGVACPGHCQTILLPPPLSGGFSICQLCPDSGDPCALNTCNFQTGTCAAVNPCAEDCSTAQCVASDGSYDCVNPQNINENASCDDFNPCTASDRCQSGVCLGTGFSGPPETPTAFVTSSPASGSPTPTPTPTVTVPPPTATPTATAPPPTATATQPPPTATRTATAPPTATVTVPPATVTRTATPTATTTQPAPTSTSTSTLPPTATATAPLPTATMTAAVPSATATSPVATATTGTEATPTPTAGVTGTPESICIGDCDNNLTVTATELVSGIDIVLGKVPLANCMAFDPNHTGKVTVVQLAQGVEAALNGCGAAAAAP